MTSVPQGVDVPIVAWQQAAIVVLFLIGFMFVVRYLMGWFSRQQETTTAHHKEQQQEWQRFIRERDGEWREWLSSSNQTNCDALERITETLDKLSHEVQNNNNLLIKHDAKVHERVEAAARRRKPSTGPLENDK